MEVRTAEDLEGRFQVGFQQKMWARGSKQGMNTEQAYLSIPSIGHLLFVINTLRVIRKIIF